MHTKPALAPGNSAQLTAQETRPDLVRTIIGSGQKKLRRLKEPVRLLAVLGTLVAVTVLKAGGKLHGLRKENGRRLLLVKEMNL